MTSEGPHHPGQEPDEVSPGTGAPAPYGVANPDLGWAPPPPATRPNPPAPAWEAQSDQPATAAWGAPATQDAQPPTAAWGAAPQGGQPPVPAWGASAPQGDQPATAAWNAPATRDDQPPTAAWGAPPQDGQPPTAAWGATATRDDQPATAAWDAARVPGQQPEPARPDAWGPPAAAPQPAWGQHDQPAAGWEQDDQPGPAWDPTTPTDGPAQPSWAGQAEQPPAAWGQPAPAARGAARVPVPGQGTPPQATPPQASPPQDAWSGQDDPHRSGGWNAGGQQDDAGQQGDDPARPGGWAPADQPAFAGQAEQAQAAWGQPAPAARGAARVPVPGQATPPQDAWSGQDDPHRSGGWKADSSPAQQDDPNRSDGWNAGGQQDDPSRSGGWVATNDQPDEQPQQNAWAGTDGSGQPGTWGAAPAPQQQEDRPAGPAWASAEPTSAPPARATATVGADGPHPWGTPVEGQQQSQQWPGTDRPERPAAPELPPVPEVEPWAPGEAWGRAAEAEPAAPPSTGNAWEPERSEDRPLYSPAPGPGISAANAVPLPPQEHRVPGASLAASRPTGFVPPAQFAPAAEPPVSAEPAGREGGPSAYEPEPAGADNGWGRVEESQSPAGPVVPVPRVSPEGGPAARAAVPLPQAEESAAGAAGSVSASASVPLNSRVMPPTDQALRPGGTPAPQPRVYGRPAQPEPADEPEQAEEHSFHPDHNPPHRFDEPGQQGHSDERGSQGRFDEQAPQGRFDEPGPQQRFDDRGPQRFDEPAQQHGYGDGPAAGAASAPGASTFPPAFPPGVPSFVDPPASNRPVNGVRPHDGDQFGGPAAPVSGGTTGQGPMPGHGSNPFDEPAFPQGQQSGTSWDAEPEQGRFDSFKPDPVEQETEAPTPKIRNGRVLALVLVAAVLILAIPLGLLMLLGKVGGDKTSPFDPPVGSCVNEKAKAVACGEGAFTVVSKVNKKAECADLTQPYVDLPGNVPKKVLCLKPSTK
ncbi:hypothetical protein [Micromonospora sp. RTGN7]|uniref:hypothetical protein n=1 Tax=Micromonospora sp. RTGN7 TaxID=3016526 RepID=UPI0029FF0887|nr:hypothetical protein [Micromonospora sp. RTGN7]